MPSRSFSATSTTRHGHLTPPKPGEEYVPVHGYNSHHSQVYRRKVTFIEKDGQPQTFAVSDGDNLLDIAQANDIEMEGACGGSCACSTCHVIVEDEAYYDKMEEPDDDENDMLDLAFGLTETSRLGCQVKMSRELDGLVVRLPSMTRNMQASDFAKK
jgi:ferredoxin-2, mitochondrial